jgi:predicted DNA-binding protein YlxM (UPF0122 family)
MLDIVILAMLEMEFTPTEIAEKMKTSRQLVYDVKKRSINNDYKF